MLELLLLGVFISVLLTVLSLGMAFGSRRQEALRRALKATEQRRQKQAKPKRTPGLSGLIRAIGRRFSTLFPDSGSLRIKLVRAGYGTRTAPLTYSSVRVMLLATLPVLTFVVAVAAGASFHIIVLMVAVAAALAVVVPAYVLRKRMASREAAIKKTLPDALDLLVVCVEAGLGLDSAILKVSQELSDSHSEIAGELKVVTQLVNAGVPRVEALREMAERTGVQQINSLVTTLVQSERLGTPIARTLRVYSDQLRTKRRQKAEETAAKAPIKMLVPMVLFVLPALFIVVVGPALIILKRTFTEMAP